MICADNYYAPTTAQSHMSSSQLKRFIECEARAIAEIRGEYAQQKTPALLVGGFVDAHFSGTIDAYKLENPDIYTRSGDLRADYRKALEIITVLESDPLLLRMLSGRQQPIYTGEILGVPFRGKLDSLLSADSCGRIAADYPDMADTLLMADGAIVDLKVMRDMEAVYKPGRGRISFVQAWHYDLQLAIYQKLVGGGLPCYIVCVTKEIIPDKALIHIPQYMLDAALATAAPYIIAADEIKQGRREPNSCGKCAWCLHNKMITGAVDADDLEGAGL